MRIAAFVVIAALPLWSQPDPRLEKILGRVSEEAAAFAEMAPRVIGRETLRQKAVKRASRFRLRIGQDALRAPPVRYRYREIVSDYGFGAFQEVPDSLHEFRTAVSVDGREVVRPEVARETLTMGVTGRDDRLRRRLLRQFEQLGLEGAATDFGQMVLLFERRQLDDYQFTLLEEGFIGADRAIGLHYQQLKGPDAVTIFEGRKAVKAPLEGELWVRASDYLPLRVTVTVEMETGGHSTRHHGVIEYFPSRFGMVLPASVRYEKIIDGQTVVENLATYADYQMFGATVEIEFEEADQ
jgi:hypothetical protein